MEGSEEGHTAFRFRLYPTRRQARKMEAVLETCRVLWNDALGERNERWRLEKKSTTYGDQSAVLTATKMHSPELRAVYSQALQNTLTRLDGAFKKFFAHETGHPRFKKKGECRSFTYPQASNGSVEPDVAGQRLHLSMVGGVRAVFHRDFPSAGMKTCCVKRGADGRWHASLTFDEEVVPLQNISIPRSWKAPVGIDLGLKSLIATSDGQKVEPQKFLRKAEEKVVKLQRNLSKKKKGSKNRGKAKLKLARQHSRVANQRMDFSQKLSTRLVRKHDLIGFEDLRIKNMIRNRSLAKSIHDAAWAQLVKFTEYKARRRGGEVVKVPARFSTQECFFCGTLNSVPLSVRQFTCRGCGMVLDRDVNSGRIVLVRMVAIKVGQDMSSVTRSGDESRLQAVPELMPVEAATRQTQVCQAVNEAGTICLEQRPGWKPTALAVGGCHHDTNRVDGAFVQSQLPSKSTEPFL